MWRVVYAAFLTLVAGPVAAQSPIDQMFPNASSCYQRIYSPDHLTSHPAQRVTKVSLMQDRSVGAPYFGLTVRVSLRGVPGGTFGGVGYCENNGGLMYCGMEGDAGGFTIEPAKNGAVLVTVSSGGMGFENERGFATLERDVGDDRSFLLQPAVCR